MRCISILQEVFKLIKCINVKAVVGRLDKIENEIRQLLQIKKKRNSLKYNQQYCVNYQEKTNFYNNEIQPPCDKPETSSNINSCKHLESRNIFKRNRNSEIRYVENVKLQNKDFNSTVIHNSVSSNEEIHPCKVCSENICDISCFISKIHQLQKILKEEKENNKNLRLEISNLEKSIHQLRQTKEESKISKEWKDKYTALKNCQCNTQLIHNQVLKDKTALTKTLEEERNKLQKATEELKRCRRLLNNKQVDTENTKELMKKLNEKNDTLINLEEKLTNSEYCNKKLHEQCCNLNNNLNILEENFKSLQNTNQELARDMLNKCKCFEAEANKAEMKLNSYKKNKLELDRLKKSCTNHAQFCAERDKMNKSLLVEINELSKELDTVRNRESSFEATIKTLENKLRILKEDYLELEEISKRNLQRLNEENSVLVGQVIELSDKLKNEEIYWTEKYNNLQNDFNSFKNSLINKEISIDGEKSQLRTVVEEMTYILKDQKQRITKLMDLNLRQEKKIKSQNYNLSVKEEQLAAAKQEINCMKLQYSDLEKRCGQLKSPTTENKLCKLEEALATLGKMVEREQEKILIKNKMLEDQNETINSLRRTISEKENSVQEINMHFEDCRKEKCDITCKLLTIEDSNKSIIQYNNQLENEISMQNNLIENLEKKLLLREAEWELKIKVLEKENEAAKEAAKFATENLFRTTQDFEKHIKTQNHTRNSLALLLKKKDDKLKGVIAQMNSLTFEKEYQDSCSCSQNLNLPSRSNNTVDNIQPSLNHSTFSYSDESFI